MKFGIVSTGGHIWKLAEDLCGPKNADQSFTVPQQIGLNEKVALLPAPRLRARGRNLRDVETFFASIDAAIWIVSWERESSFRSAEYDVNQMARPAHRLLRVRKRTVDQKDNEGTQKTGPKFFMVILRPDDLRASDKLAMQLYIQEARISMQKLPDSNQPSDGVFWVEHTKDGLADAVRRICDHARLHEEVVVDEEAVELQKSSKALNESGEEIEKMAERFFGDREASTVA